MSELERMIGTTGNDDYAVVVKTEDYKIGMKPIFDSAHSQTFVGMRIRLVATKDNEDVVDFDPEAKLKSFFPSIPWQQTGADRLSLVGGCVVNIPQNSPVALHGWLRQEKIIDNLLDKLKSLFDLKLENKKELKKFYMDVFCTAYKKPIKQPKITNGSAVVNLGDYKDKLQSGDIEYIEEE